MSIREQERRQREVERRIIEAMNRADRKVRQRAEARPHEATLRAQEVVRRVEKGDVQPCPLPGLREASMRSMESIPSMQSAASIESMRSTHHVSEVSEESVSGTRIQEDMPLQEIMPYDPAQAEENLAQRVTEETGSEGDPHLHNERKTNQMGNEMFQE